MLARAARDGHQLQTPQAYAEALHLYTGDLVVLDHRVQEDGTRGYRDWLRGLRVTLLVRLAGLQEQTGDVAAAIERAPTLFLVRARGYAGAFQRRLEVGVLREALSNLLRQGDDNGHLIVDVLIEGRKSATVAAERSVSEAMLVEMLREAVDALAVEYEDAAYASLGESEQERVRSALAGKRR